jgi:nitrogen fixation NifU-like protein
MYTDRVTDHFNNPRNMGEVENYNAEGTVGNAKCGDIMRMTMRISGNVIEEVKFKTFGCGAAIATSSIATEMVKGKTVEEALLLTNRAVVEALEGLPPQKIHCSVLAEEAVKAAIADYHSRNNIEQTGKE